MTQTVVGIFDTPDAARSAEEQLVSRGVDRSAVHITSAGAIAQERPASTTGGIRHFFSELFGTGHTEVAGTYSEAVRRGGIMLAVDVPDDADVEPVQNALENAGAIDIDQRAEQWRRQGWTGYDPEARPYTAEEIARERGTVMPVIEEQMQVGKREVSKGVVRVFSRTIETPVQETVNLREEHATVERHMADRPATQADLEAFGEKSIEIEETEEKAVVSKEARVVGEVVVGKEATQSTETIKDTVRHTEVEVERGTAGMGATRRPYEDYEPDYRQDFQTRYAAQGGGTYEEYAPAYRYGHGLASDTRYQGRAWQEIEPEARRDWERRYPNSAWESFKLAVRHGWERVSGKR